MRLPTVTLISSFFAFAAGVFTVDMQTAERPNLPEIHRPTNQMDACITRAFREQLSAEKELTLTARSIRAYASNGVLKLRGNVIYPEERTRILEKARAMPGVSAVDEQLSILAP